MQTEKRKNKQDDDDKADQINYSVHDRPPDVDKADSIHITVRLFRSSWQCPYRCSTRAVASSSSRCALLVLIRPVMYVTKTTLDVIRFQRRSGFCCTAALAPALCSSQLSALASPVIGNHVRSPSLAQRTEANRRVTSLPVKQSQERDRGRSAATAARST